jgi:hypothetical protein
MNVAPPSFLRFEPTPFLRPFDAFDERRCNHEHFDLDVCSGGVLSRIDTDGG